MAMLQAPAALASEYVPSSAVPGVTHLSARSVTFSTVRLTWRWPTAKSVVAATVRVARGSKPPASVFKGRLAGKVTRPHHTITVSGLRPRTRYSFAVFAKTRRGRFSRPVTLRIVTRAVPPLRIRTRALASGVRGLFYLQALSVRGGISPYRWSATRLPAGLSLSKGGVISGYPLSTGTRTITLRVRDVRRVSARRRLRLAIPVSLPAGCIAKSCAKLKRDGHTIQVRRGDIVSVTRHKGRVTSVVLTHAKVSSGDIAVLAPAKGIRSGLIALVRSVTVHGSKSTVAVGRATPADAYYQGVVQAIGKPVRPQVLQVAADSQRRVPGLDLSCKDKVKSDLHGLTVTPDLTPTMALDWKHRLFGGHGIYAGFGGLKLFQFGLIGTITVDLGVSVSAKARCELDLPSFDRVIPAGDLGAILVQLDPSLTLDTSAQAEVRTSVTLRCEAGFTWRQGKSSRTDFCKSSYEPLRLTADSGVDATVTGTIDASASLDDLPGVKGAIDASLHAGYHPAQQPIAEIDAKSHYDLRATLANLWSHAPTLTIVDGTLFDATLATYGSPPPHVGAGGPPRITVKPHFALVWNSAVCGFDNPTFGSNKFTVFGTSFVPNEPIAISTGWKSYPGTHPANPDGGFGITERVGEVPSVFDETFEVDATGRSGTDATSTIELNSDGCFHQSDNNGTVTLKWGGNGFDPDSTIDLSIDGNTISSATTDNLGSGGSSASFTCPSSGSYSWEISGTVNGSGVAASGTFNCSPGSRHGRSQPADRWAKTVAS